jgi:hypothetical protein
MYKTDLGWFDRDNLVWLGEKGILSRRGITIRPITVKGRTKLVSGRYKEEDVESSTYSQFIKVSEIIMGELNSQVESKGVRFDLNDAATVCRTFGLEKPYEYEGKEMLAKYRASDKVRNIVWVINGGSIKENRNTEEEVLGRDFE